jgi:hypothetical protein
VRREVEGPLASFLLEERLGRRLLRASIRGGRLALRVEE